MANTTHITVFSIHSFSHQASIIEFCKRLVTLNNHFHVTCIFPTVDSPPRATISILESLPPNIDYIFLPPVNQHDLPQGITSELETKLIMSRSMASFRHELESLCSTTSTVALIADPWANEALEIAKQFNLLSFIYFPFSAMATSLFLLLPSLHEKISCDHYNVLKEPIELPGCVPIHGHVIPEHLHDRFSLDYEIFILRSKRLSLADGLLVNSFAGIEAGTASALEAGNNIPVYMVGPITQIGSSNGPNGSKCISWLENQTPKSVLYVSFGSGCTLSQEQINELALGLELSGTKFMWVLRVPSDSSNTENDDPLFFLPHGFLERTKEQGLVVPSWAPQAQILSHTSIGGFLNHCGWNSVLESIMRGVPMITWPLAGENKLNEVLLTEGLKVALRAKFNENGIVVRKEIAKVINGLMLGEEGNEIRQRIEEFKDAAANAINEGGSSIKALSQVGFQIENFRGAGNY